MGNQNYLFFNHRFPESVIENLQSKSNIKEAEIIIRFTNYLML